MSTRLFRRGLVALSACSLTLAAATAAPTTATAAPAAATRGWRVADVIGPAGGSTGVDGVVATGAQDAWAAGSYCGSPCGSGSNTPQFFVAQWNGTAWRQLSLPGSVTSAVHNPGFAVVGAGSATDAWVFVGGSQGSTDYTYALDWNGSGWSSQRFASEVSIQDTEVFSASDAWAFGIRIEKTTNPYNLHYNGKTWSKVTLPGRVDAVSATSASNMWAFGTRATTVIVMRWNGMSWSTLSLPKLSLPPGEGLIPTSIATLSPTDVWVASALSEGRGEAPGYVLLHWNGTAWQRVTIPYKPYSVGYLAQDGDGGVWLTAYTKSSAAYIDHDSAAGTWSEQEAPTEPGNSTQPSGLAWVPGTTSDWAGGVLLPGEGSSQGVILGYGD
jgi:hypothetical protein